MIHTIDLGRIDRHAQDEFLAPVQAANLPARLHWMQCLTTELGRCQVRKSERKTILAKNNSPFIVNESRSRINRPCRHNFNGR
jgi:hypothetical protein